MGPEDGLAVVHLRNKRRGSKLAVVVPVSHVTQLLVSGGRQSSMAFGVFLGLPCSCPSHLHASTMTRHVGSSLSGSITRGSVPRGPPPLGSVILPESKNSSRYPHACLAKSSGVLRSATAPTREGVKERSVLLVHAEPLKLTLDLVSNPPALGVHGRVLAVQESLSLIPCHLTHLPLTHAPPEGPSQRSLAVEHPAKANSITASRVMIGNQSRLFTGCVPARGYTASGRSIPRGRCT